LNKAHLIFLYALIAFLFLWVFYLNPKNQESEQTVTIVEQANGNTFTVTIPEPKHQIFETPDKVFFAGEEVPLNFHDIRERYEREIYVNAYWQSSTLLLLKRAPKYLSIIEDILKKNNIPEDFKYVAIAESGLLNVTSSAGAKGFWQIMPATAKENQLEVSDEVDERYHLEKSTEAACKYFRTAYARFGSWTAVAASYNMGISGYQKRKQEQKFESYYDLFLNDETSRYVFRILAFKAIFEDPKKFGYEIPKSELYAHYPMRELKVTQSIPDLASWAIKHNSNYKYLKLNNPWLRDKKLTISSGKSYIIKLPLQN
jgi:membrane-bound lytic murein transglycosylase D